MNVTKYINEPQYGGREHFAVEGNLADYLNCNIRDYNDDDVFTLIDLFLKIAWEAVAKEYPTRYESDYGYQLRNQHAGYIEITFYRRE